jgi:outer membrane protein TolC
MTGADLVDNDEMGGQRNLSDGGRSVWPRRLAARVSWVVCITAGCLPGGNLVQPPYEPLPDRVPVARAAGEDVKPDAGPELTLAEAVAQALAANPRLEAYRAAVARSRGQADAAFAPFLPQVDVLNRAGAVTRTLQPGAPGIVGGISPAEVNVPYNFAQTEFQIQWTLCDFGRTSGRYGQAVSREKIAELQEARARQTVAFDAATAYFEGLQARALRVVQEEAVRQARAVLEDTRARQQAGAALREAVLRAEVTVSESSEGLVLADESELAALARLNNVLGRNAALPLRLAERGEAPPLRLSLVDCLEKAAQQRPEVAATREAVAAASQGRDAAAAEFCPRIYLLAALGAVTGEHIVRSPQEGAGIHLSQPLYHGGRQRGELRAADAEVQEALAQSRVLLDAVSLEVALAYRHATASRRRIDLARPAVTQARENLRLSVERYRNGNATPVDVVDAQTALTRARQRLVRAGYDYQAALARLDYAMGNAPGCLLEAADLPPASPPAELPAPRPVAPGEVKQEGKLLPAPSRAPP